MVSTILGSTAWDMDGTALGGIIAMVGTILGSTILSGMIRGIMVAIMAGTVLGTMVAGEAIMAGTALGTTVTMVAIGIIHIMVAVTILPGLATQVPSTAMDLQVASITIILDLTIVV